MNGPYRIIDESNFNVLGTFDSIESAVDFIATLLSVNDEDYLDDLTIGSPTEGPILYGEALRHALQDRASGHQQPHVTGEGGAPGTDDPRDRFAAMAAKSRK